MGMRIRSQTDHREKTYLQQITIQLHAAIRRALDNRWLEENLLRLVRYVYKYVMGMVPSEEAGGELLWRKLMGSFPISLCKEAFRLEENLIFQTIYKGEKWVQKI